MNATIRLTGPDRADFGFHAGQLRRILMDMGTGNYQGGATRVVAATERQLSLSDGGDPYGYDVEIDVDNGPVWLDLEITTGPTGDIEFTLEGGTQHVIPAGTSSRLVFECPSLRKGT